MRSTAFLAAALALALGASPAFAFCVLCNSAVRLDAALATCFANRADDEIAALAKSGKDFVIVDLSDCTTRGGLPTGSASGTPALDTQFVADGPGLKCLSAQIEAADDTSLDPSRLFDLGKDCPQ